MAKNETIKLVANNKKAYHDYFIEEKYECGIALHGTEVKSLRMGKCSIKEAFIRIENGEVFVYGMHISPYEKGNIFNKDPLRVKKLLMHRQEIRKLLGKIKEKVLHVVRSFMTNVKILRKKMRVVKPNVQLKENIFSYQKLSALALSFLLVRARQVLGLL